MEEKSAESGTAEEAAPPSVAKLAGIFGDKVNSPRKEVPPPKPTRRKPPCSLPLPKTTVTNNGDEKVSPPQPQMPKVKVKSSPLIEKLQANLAFPPVFLPGVSPKSPGLKVMASPFSSPPSTPNSPSFPSHQSESEETPVSFEQPPEGAHLQSVTKVRTRGSIKRRPPSRSFRKSQTDMDFDIDKMTTTGKENGDKTIVGDAEPRLLDKQDTALETGAASPESVDKSPQSQSNNQDKTEREEDSGKTRSEDTPQQINEAPDRGQGEKDNRAEKKLDTRETDTQVTKEEDLTVNPEKTSEEGKGVIDEQDGDDNPEK